MSATSNITPGLGAAGVLAPKGILRVGVVEGPIAGVFFVAREAGSGRLRGVTIDLGTALGSWVGVPVEHHAFPNSGECTDATANGAVDVSFMPVDEDRKNKVAFGPAYYLLESTYLVSAVSGITTLAEVDQAHVRVVGIAGTTTIRASTRSLRNTVPSALRSVEEAIAAMREDHADALALSRDSLQQITTVLPGSRIVEGGFQHTTVSIAVPNGRPIALREVTAFLEDVKARGIVRSMFDDAGLRDEPVAPAAT